MKHIYKNLNFYGIMELICEFIRLILQSIKLIYQSTSDIKSLLLTLPKFRRHQLIQLCIAWEFIDKRHEGAAHFQKPLPRTDIRDIAHLKVGNVKELRKLDSVRGRLVQHDNELAVGKHRPRRMALQEVVHILCDSSTVRPILTHTLPEGKEEVGGILVLEQQINFINEDKCVPAFRPVLGDAV